MGSSSASIAATVEEPASDAYRLIAQPEAIRGRLRAHVDLSKRCWFRTGGAAQWLFTPEDADDLACFFSQLDRDIPVTVMGVGSNLLIRDGGIDGVVIRLGRGFADISHHHESVHAGAAALDVNVAEYAAQHCLSGLEFLCGIPGTIGGAVAMNAGAYGSDIASVARDIEAMDRGGQRHIISAEDAGFAYRRSSLPPGWVITGLRLRAAQKGDNTEIRSTMARIAGSREASQPVRSRTGGSTFRNPEGAKAWELIDRAGCRGLRRGDAEVSTLHCNFLINHGAATSEDLEALGEEVRRRVLEDSGIALRWEIRRIGNPLAVRYTS